MKDSGLIKPGSIHNAAVLACQPDSEPPGTDFFPVTAFGGHGEEGVDEVHAGFGGFVDDVLDPVSLSADEMDAPLGQHKAEIGEVGIVFPGSGCRLERIG
jgi:hypothetical protein